MADTAAFAKYLNAVCAEFLNICGTSFENLPLVASHFGLHLEHGRPPWLCAMDYLARADLLDYVGIDDVTRWRRNPRSAALTSDIKAADAKYFADCNRLGINNFVENALIEVGA